MYLLSKYEFKFLILLLLINSLKSNKSNNNNSFYIKKSNIDYNQNCINNTNKTFLSKK